MGSRRGDPGDDAARVVLARAPGLTGRHMRSIVAAAGDDLASGLEPRRLAALELPPRTLAYLTSPDESVLRRDLAWLHGAEARILLAGEADYPPLLGAVRDAPSALFVIGAPAVLREPQIAVVGSRTPTPVGLAAAGQFARAFAQCGLTVTSGLALGIDAAGHEGALAGGGRTVAVCGRGLDRIYPTQHSALAARIATAGALVTALPPGAPPRPANFARRNKLLSALSLGVVVIEAGEHSGSLVTAAAAMAQNRPVFALPGSPREPRARGCHKLIRAGARLVEHPVQVLDELGFPHAEERLARTVRAARPVRRLDKEYEMLLDAVDLEPATPDALGALTGLPAESIASMLLILELEGRIAPYPGGRFGRAPG